MRMGQTERVRPTRTICARAGVFRAGRCDAGDARTALALFERALTPTQPSARSHGHRRCTTCRSLPPIPGVPPDIATARARASVERALRLDGTLPEAHLAAAKLHMMCATGRQRAATTAGDRPGAKASLARQQYALWLSYQEQFEDALKEARLAESFDPLSPAAANNVAEDFAKPAASTKRSQAQHALALNPNFGRAHAVMAQCYLGQGRPDLAIEEFQRRARSTAYSGSRTPRLAGSLRRGSWSRRSSGAISRRAAGRAKSDKSTSASTNSTVLSSGCRAR